VRGSPVVDFGKPIGVDAQIGKPTNQGTIHSGKKVRTSYRLNPDKQVKRI